VSGCAPQELAPLPCDDQRAGAEARRFVERVTRVLETPKSDQCEGPAELSVSEVRSACDDRVVLHEGAREVAARERQGRQADTILQRIRVGQEASTVSALGAGPIAA